MRNKKALLAGALMVPALALTGGIAYATTGSHPTPARTAVTTTVQHSKDAASQARHYRCDWRPGAHRCDRNGHRYQQQPTQRQAVQYRSHRNAHQGSGYGWGGYGYQGRGSSGSGQYGGGWGNGGGCCRHGW